jgi:AcrR family transcriptional regulator
MPRPTPAYARLDVDERRRRLLALGADLFTHHAYDELSMAAIARAAGISKALLYHYFPSKEAYFLATLESKAAELAEVTRTDSALPPLEQVAESLNAYVGWVEANAQAYEKMIRAAGAVPEVRAMVDRIRADAGERILAGLSPTPDALPAVRIAIAGWLWFLDGVLLEWIARRDLDRERLARLLLGTLLGAIAAAG